MRRYSKPPPWRPKLGLKRWVSEERAASGSEYAFMLALIIISLVGVISFLGETEKNIFSVLDTTISTSIEENL